MEDVAEHRHCRVCRKVCSPDSETCSKTCERERARRLESRRNSLYVLYALAAVVIAVFVLSTLHL
ncbi:MAG TPA: DUF2116 family Zn-ribbon domain-containing protein [Thermoplasmata archaeon]|nr:DUF2116 family Zn-ribbon domain-containing protein [Thermoplasmata archaeon]HEV2519251.1 DUF2116 family Zn-ribbon domain-containing protein [Thermoplasmata archaeon]